MVKNLNNLVSQYRNYVDLLNYPILTQSNIPPHSLIQPQGIVGSVKKFDNSFVGFSAYQQNFGGTGSIQYYATFDLGINLPFCIINSSSYIKILSSSPASTIYLSASADDSSYTQLSTVATAGYTAGNEKNVLNSSTFINLRYLKLQCSGAYDSGDYANLVCGINYLELISFGLPK